MTSISEKPVEKKNFGPFGYGDPDDRTLRINEKKILIPQKRREIVKNEYCSKEIEEYQNCVLQNGLLLAPLKCRELKVNMADCLEYWNESDELYRRAKEEYLQERSEFRRTGVCAENRKYISEYIESMEKEKS